MPLTCPCTASPSNHLLGVRCAQIVKSTVCATHASRNARSKEMYRSVIRPSQTMPNVSEKTSDLSNAAALQRVVSPAGWEVSDCLTSRIPHECDNWNLYCGSGHGIADSLRADGASNGQWVATRALCVTHGSDRESAHAVEGLDNRRIRIEDLRPEAFHVKPALGVTSFRRFDLLTFLRASPATRRPWRRSPCPARQRARSRRDGPGVRAFLSWHEGAGPRRRAAFRSSQSTGARLRQSGLARLAVPCGGQRFGQSLGLLQPL